MTPIRNKRLTLQTVLALALIAGIARCLAANTLVITSPASGTLVTPGQLLTVTVMATGAYPNGVAIVGGSPTVVSQGFQTGSNLTFSITIPATANAGPFFGISAVAATATGTLVRSTEVALDVERADYPESLEIQPAGMQLRFIGDSLPADVVGIFADGTHLLMTSSSLLQVTSSNPSVAVFQSGAVVAAGAGTANVTFSVGSISQSIGITVPTAIRGDLNADGRVDENDVNILNQALNTPATIANDARDLNGDGQITTADRTILQSLCTVQKPLCSTK